MALPVGLPLRLRGAGPITIQVSPSTYQLMMRLIRICVDYDGNNNLVLNGGAGGAVDTALNNLYAALAPADAAALRQLQDDGLDEASAINKAAGHELVLPS